MKAILALGAVLCSLGASVQAAGPPPSPYSAVEVDPFTAERGLAFPAADRSALVEEIAREVSLTFETVVILRQGETAYGHAVLRISGTVTKFMSGNRAKKYLIGLGAGTAILQARVQFSDAASGRILLTRQLKGVISTGAAAQAAADSLARKIAKLCNSARLVESN